ncbi:MAG: helix-turn-helix domain-containing protein [Oscillospiraceae bacterium]|nr:helix-turn-helix domain-containing protein [Oscillospiraceae bacterium]
MENKSIEEIESSNKNFLSTTEVAAVLGISANTFRKRADEYAKLFPVERVGKRYRIPKAPFIAYVRTGKSFM